MSKLPTTAEMVDGSGSDVYQTRFQDWLDGTRQGLGCDDQQPLVISAGQLAPDGRAVIVMDTQGGTAADDLNGIDPSEYHAGALVLLRSTDNARVPTVKHNVGGTERFILNNNADFELTTVAHALLVVRQADHWREVFRSFGGREDQTRTFLGLGTAATFDAGPGNGLDADTVDGQDAADFLSSSGTAADSAQLVGVAGANYARKDAAGGGQTFEGSVSTNAGLLLVNRDLAGGSSILEFRNQGASQALVFYDATTDRVYITNELGAAGPNLLYLDLANGDFKVKQGGVEAEILTDQSSQVLLGAGAAALLGAEQTATITLNRASFMPAIEVDDALTVHIGRHAPTQNPDVNAPQIEIENPTVWSFGYSVQWEYFKT